MAAELCVDDCTFDGGKVVAIERDIDGWPSDEDLEGAESLYVSADLRCFCASAEQLELLAIDVTQGDADRRRAYRRLDARWYAWLYRAAQGALQDLRPDDPERLRIRARMNSLWLWAKCRHGADKVVRAQALALGPAYQPPVVVPRWRPND